MTSPTPSSAITHPIPNLTPYLYSPALAEISVCVFESVSKIRSIHNMLNVPRKLRVIDSPDPERPMPIIEAPKEKLKLGTKQINEINKPFEATTQPITVHGILAENLKHSMPAAKPLDLRKPHSRRKRDYLVLMIVGNSPLALEGIIPGILPFAIIWCFLFSVMFTWILWFVMSDY